MSDKTAEIRIRRALRELSPRQDANTADLLWEQKVERASGGEWYLDGLEEKGRAAGRKKLLLGLSAAACFLFLLIGLSCLYFIPVSSICLDVNPAIELQLNRLETVLRVKAINADGEEVLSGLPLKGQTAAKALERLSDALYRKGYLSAEHNVLLLSVEDADSQKACERSKNLSKGLHQYLQQLIGKNRIYYQAISSTAPTSLAVELQKEWTLSEGKATLLARLLSEHPDLEAKELRSSFLQLERYLRKRNISLKDLLDAWSDLPDENEAQEAEEEESDEPYARTSGKASPDREEDEKEEADEDEDEDEDDKGSFPELTAGGAGKEQEAFEEDNDEGPDSETQSFFFPVSSRPGSYQSDPDDDDDDVSEMEDEGDDWEAEEEEYEAEDDEKD